MMTVLHNLRTRSFAAVLAIGLGTATPVAAAPPAGAPAAESAEVRADLVLKTDALGDGGPSMQDLLGLLEEDVLRKRHVGPASSDADPKIIVVIRPLSDKAGVLDYHVDITIEQGGELLTDATWGFDCTLCDDGRLLDKVAVTLHTAVTRIEEEAKRMQGAAAGDEDDQGELGPPPPQEDNVARAKPGPLVWAGAAVAVVGVGGISVGLPLALREDEIVGGLDSDERLGKQTRTPGWVATGLGAAALVTGGALLGVGLIRWKRDKDRQAPAPRATTVAPWAGAHGAGLSVHGRF